MTDKKPMTGPAADARSAAAAGLVSGGLVPSKTTGNRVNEWFKPEPLAMAKATASTVSFSEESQALARVKRLKRSVWASGHLHGLGDRGFRNLVPWFVTLTYVRDDQWKPDHIKVAMAAYRRFCKAAKIHCRYTWVAELQTRGAVHYHLLAWLPAGVQMPHWDRARGNRLEFWPHGMTNTEVAKSGVGYLMKYLSKLGELTKFPKGLRLYGVGGLTETGRSVRQWFNLPAWVKLSHGVGEVSRRTFGFVHRVTGEVLQCPYRCDRIPGGILLVLLRPLAERFHDGAYSSFPRAVPDYN